MKKVIYWSLPVIFFAYGIEYTINWKAHGLRAGERIIERGIRFHSFPNWCDQKNSVENKLIKVYSRVNYIEPAPGLVAECFQTLEPVELKNGNIGERQVITNVKCNAGNLVIEASYAFYKPRGIFAQFTGNSVAGKNWPDDCKYIRYESDKFLNLFGDADPHDNQDLGH